MTLIRIALLLALSTAPVLVRAESLRCSGGSVTEGDSRLSLVYKCGPPEASDAFCAPVYYAGSINVVPDPWASMAVPCQLVEQFLYPRGPGELLATVYIRRGIVQSITYSRTPN
jgi:hypothetical protein